MFVYWPAYFPLMFGVQYLNYHHTLASYQEGGASDAHYDNSKFKFCHTLAQATSLSTVY